MTKGLSEKGLARLHEVLADHVDRGALPGLIALVSGGGRTHVEVIGTKTLGDSEPMERDAIFRIASLSKPITAVATMILVDDGTLRLEDPVDEFLPELADRRVLRSLDAPLDDTVPAERPIRVEDLLTSRMGFGAVMAPPNTYPIQAAEEELELRTLGPPWPPSPHRPDEWIRLLGTLPWMHQPGEGWLYNTGPQVAGVLVERASGMPFEAFLRRRLFEPLGMRDSAFSVPPDRLSRLTTAYAPDPDSGDLHVIDAVAWSFWASPPAMPNGAGWLVSTMDDYWAFVQMLLSDGAGNGGRILSADSVERMTSDHLTHEQRRSAAMFLGPAESWGLGLAVPASGAGAEAIPQGFGWDGGLGTTWRSDTRRDLTGILFTQRAMTSPEPPELFTDFWACAYDAMTESG